MSEITNLFEYQNKEKFDEDYLQFEDFLNDIWSKREKNSFYYDNQDKKEEIQQFISFFHKSKELKSKNFVGFIHFNKKTINLLPKIFYDNQAEKTINVKAIQQHILWYLSYCRKIRFPHFQSSLRCQKNDFFETIIYMFARYTLNLLSSSIYQQYEDIENELSNIKGRINIPSYISNNLSKARWHKVSCIYDSFILDNKFNRILKYVSQMLVSVTKEDDNKKMLNDILFVLDDVGNERFTANQCESIVFNPMLKDFEIVRDYCTLFLATSISIAYKNELQLFAFLLPMEYIFEDFVYGFIDKELKDLRIEVSPQSTSHHLDEEKKFNLKPDLLIKIDDKRIILDTKYKLLLKDNNISQSDLYQIICYAIRFECQKVFLLYPCSVQKTSSDSDYELNINDELAGKKIKIKICFLPIINKDLLTRDKNFENCSIREIFETQTNMLKGKLSDLLKDVSYSMK